MSGGKPRGLNAARKLRNNRREQRWSDLHYKKRALGTAFKSRYASIPTMAMTMAIAMEMGTTTNDDGEMKRKRWE